MSDVDFVEWRYIDGEIVPVAIIELTRADIGMNVNQAWLDAALTRYSTHLQGKGNMIIAKALNVSAYVVVFREDCSEFWVYNLIKGNRWHHGTEEDYIRFLRGLGKGGNT
jgi:hypothetical protein